MEANLCDLGADVSLNDISFYRVGRNIDTSRPLVLKLKRQEIQAEVLFKAKGLKNNEKWQGVSITHDLTKLQCQEEKAGEVELRRMADEKNRRLLENERLQNLEGDWRARNTMPCIKLLKDI